MYVGMVKKVKVWGLEAGMVRGLVLGLARVRPFLRPETVRVGPWRDRLLGVNYLKLRIFDSVAMASLIRGRLVLFDI